MTSKLRRETKETEIELSIDMYGEGSFTGTTGNGFFDHMMTAMTFYSGMDIKLSLKGDFQVCQHHAFEDFGLVLGKGIREEILEKLKSTGTEGIGMGKGINRFSSVYMPMDESLVRVVLDISGRPFLQYKMLELKDRIGDFETETLKEFLRAFTVGSQSTLHIEALYGENSHHLVEAMFKGLGRALKESLNLKNQLQSTKGMLD